MLKIDRSFTRNLAPESSDMALSDAIIVMAHKLGLRVIAEGVETEQQRNFLQANGCHLLQGYRYVKPLDALALEHFWRGRLFGVATDFADRDVAGTLQHARRSTASRLRAS